MLALARKGLAGDRHMRDLSLCLGMAGHSKTEQRGKQAGVQGSLRTVRLDGANDGQAAPRAASAPSGAAYRTSGSRVAGLQAGV
jgi:hypothetical protein